MVSTFNLIIIPIINWLYQDVNSHIYTYNKNVIIYIIVRLLYGPDILWFFFQQRKIPLAFLVPLFISATRRIECRLNPKSRIQTTKHKNPCNLFNPFQKQQCNLCILSSREGANPLALWNRILPLFHRGAKKRFILGERQ